MFAVYVLSFEKNFGESGRFREKSVRSNRVSPNPLISLQKGL